MRKIVAICAALGCLALTNFSWIYGSPQPGKTYYMSSSGSDGNNGTSPVTPWATPNHTVNCGDTIIAAAGTYSEFNLSNGEWGTVGNCPSALGIYFAALQCAGPSVGSCNIAATVVNGMYVDKSNWAVIGWQASSTAGACFGTAPSGLYGVRFVAFINVIASGCQSNGVTANAYFADAKDWGVDEVAFVGAIAYDAARGTDNCYSGVSVNEPKNIGSESSTHVFIAGIFLFTILMLSVVAPISIVMARA